MSDTLICGLIMLAIVVVAGILMGLYLASFSTSIEDEEFEHESGYIDETKDI